MSNIWKYVKLTTFFRDLLPHIKNPNRKADGFNWRGGPADFTEKEKKEINEALKKLVQENKLK